MDRSFVLFCNTQFSWLFFLSLFLLLFRLSFTWFGFYSFITSVLFICLSFSCFCFHYRCMNIRAPLIKAFFSSSSSSFYYHYHFCCCCCCCCCCCSSWLINSNYYSIIPSTLNMEIQYVLRPTRTERRVQSKQFIGKRVSMFFIWKWEVDVRISRDGRRGGGRPSGGDDGQTQIPSQPAWYWR